MREASGLRSRRTPRRAAAKAAQDASLPPVPTTPSRPPATEAGGAAGRDFSPEKPIGRLPAPASQKGFWIFVWLIGAGFIGVVTLIIVLSKLLH